MTGAKGVTTVQATMLLILISLGAISFVYAWFSGVLTSVMKIGIYTPPTADWCSAACQLSSAQQTHSAMASISEKREILLAMERPPLTTYYFNATPGFIPEIVIEPEKNPYTVSAPGEYSRVFATPVVFSDFPISFNMTWTNMIDNKDNFTYKMTIYMKRDDVPDIGLLELLAIPIVPALLIALARRTR